MKEAGFRRAWAFPVRRRDALLTRARRLSMPPAKTLRELGLRRGMRLLDVGCGPGYFAVPACRVVGRRGTVWACDVSPTMLRETRAEARARGFANLRAVRCGDAGLPLPDASADMALAAFVLHEVDGVSDLLAEVLRVLRPGGAAALIEWHKRETSHGPPLWARFRPDELRRELTETGFAACRWWDHDGNTYFVSGRRPERDGHEKRAREKR